MRLYGELFKKTSLGELFHLSRCCVLLGGGGYFEGVKGVSEFSKDKLVLALKDGTLELLGKDFTIAKYCDGDLEIAGEIYSFAYAKKEKNGG